MNERGPQLRRLFAAAKSVRRARINAEASAPFGFGGRVVSRWQGAAPSNGSMGSWSRLSGWGLGMAGGVMLLSLVWNWKPLHSEWSPTYTVVAQVTEFVSSP